MGCMNKDLEHFSQEIRERNREQYIEMEVHEEIIDRRDVLEVKENYMNTNKEVKRINGKKRTCSLKTEPMHEERKRFRKGIAYCRTDRLDLIESNFTNFVDNIKKDIHEQRENGKIIHFPQQEIME